MPFYIFYEIVNVVPVKNAPVAFDLYTLNIVSILFIWILLIIDIDNTYGGGYLRDIVALPYETNTLLNGTKLRAIFKNVHLWEPQSPYNTLDGRLANTWYDHFGGSQGLIYDTDEAYFDFMWYNGIWFCDGIS